MPNQPTLPPQAFVTTPDGRRLAYITVGQGPKLVVCDAGLGLAAHYWLPVMHVLAGDCTVIAYNRAGIGVSDPDDHVRDLARLSEDLAALICAHTFEELYLVGHSWGAAIVRAYALTHQLPEGLLRGLVLVDPSDENLAAWFKPWMLSFQARTMVALAHARLLRLLLGPIVRGLPDRARTATLADSCTVNAARESAAELTSLRSGLGYLAAHNPDVGIPTTIISGGKTMPGESKKMRGAIVGAHQATAARIAGCEVVIAEHSGHNVPITEPHVVAQAIRKLFK